MHVFLRPLLALFLVLIIAPAAHARFLTGPLQMIVLRDQSPQHRLAYDPASNASIAMHNGEVYVAGRDLSGNVSVQTLDGRHVANAGMMIAPSDHIELISAQALYLRVGSFLMRIDERAHAIDHSFGPMHVGDAYVDVANQIVTALGSIVTMYTLDGSYLRSHMITYAGQTSISVLSVEADSEGALVMASSVDGEAQDHRLVTHVRADGTLDHDFGIDGVLFDLGLPRNEQVDIDRSTITSDWTSNAAMRLVDGLPDGSFVAPIPQLDGRYGVYAQGALSYAPAGVMASDDAGTIVAATVVIGKASPLNLVVAAYDAAGNLDTKFGVDGVASVLDAKRKSARITAMTLSETHVYVLVQSGSEYFVSQLAR